MIVIVGAGLAGLSAAYHLRGLPYKILEREREVGGLCRSYVKDGFTFDYTGHLLHFRQTAIKALVESLLPDRLQRHARKSFVFSHDTYTEYPFQVNTHGLPPEVVRECLLGFIATLTRTSSTPPAESPSFKQWIIESLGEGIAKHFMVPFNEKLWQVPLDELTSDWVSWLVPKPDAEHLGPFDEAIASLRVSFGLPNTEAEVDAFLPAHNLDSLAQLARVLAQPGQALTRLQPGRSIAG